MREAIKQGFRDGMEYGAEPWIGKRVFHGWASQCLYEAMRAVGDYLHAKGLRIKGMEAY